MEKNLLYRLLQHFYVDDQGGLNWDWKAGHPLNEFDPRLNQDLIRWGKETKVADCL